MMQIKKQFVVFRFSQVDFVLHFLWIVWQRGLALAFALGALRAARFG